MTIRGGRTPISMQLGRLEELMAALERRVPHLERVGEASIARDAAALKKRAAERIAQLEKLSRAARRSSESC
jgi:hypothetical protein